MEDVGESILQNAQMPAALLDESDCIISVNRSFHQLTGRTSDELVGLSMRTLIQLGDGDTESGVALLSREYISSEYDHSDFRNGEEFPLKIERISIPQNSAPQRTLLLLIDLTRINAPFSDNLHMARLASLGKLLSGVIHEISNPLAIIHGCAQLLSLRDLPEEITGEVAKISAESKRSSDLVKTVLSYSRKTMSAQEPFDLLEIIQGAATLKCYSLKNNNIVIRQNGHSSGPLMVYGYRVQLMQVVLNLINNAEQAIAGTSGKGLIEISAQETAKSAVLSVSDTGPGIPGNIKSRIFEAYYTTKDEDRGTGLGLYLSRKIICKHHGKLELAESSEGRTVFKVSLPLHQSFQGDHKVTRTPTVTRTSTGADPGAASVL